MSFNKEIFGCEVLYENGTDEYNRIVDNLGETHYYFVYGYSSVFGENSFMDSRIDYEIPFISAGHNSAILFSNSTKSDLNGVWRDGNSTHLYPFNSYRKPHRILIFYKKSKAKKKAIILHTCELLKFHPNVPLTIRNISCLFYFAEDEPNDNEIEELKEKYNNNVTVLQKYSKYKDPCVIVNYTFNGCPAEDSEKFNYTFLWIFIFASAVVLFIISEMSCKQCLEPKRNRIGTEPRARVLVENRNRTQKQKVSKLEPNRKPILRT